VEVEVSRVKRTFAFDPANPRRESVLEFMCEVIRTAGQKLEIKVSDPTRTLEQNAKLWACLSDISRQVQWPVDGRLQFLSPEDWKDVLSAGLHKEQRIAQGIEGGFVILGQRTSQMSKRQLAELIEFIQYFGADKGVEWSEAA
jgi:hypothetical protein